MATASAPARLSGAQRRLAIGLVLSVTVVAFEATAVATALPSVEADLGGLRYYGWVSSGFMLANLVGIVLAGPSADRRGPARPYGLGLALFTAGLVAAGLAPSMPILVAARVLQGIGAGHITACAYVGIGRGLDDHLRAKVLALMAAAWIVPGLVGPAIAGAVAEHLSWRLVFLGLTPVVLLPVATALPALAALGPPAQADDGADPDAARPRSLVPRALQLALGVAIAVAGLDLRPLWLGLPIAAAGAAIAVDALRHGLVPEGTFRARGLVPAALAFRFLQTLSLFSVDLFLPLTVSRLQGASATEGGLTLTSAAVTWAGGSWLHQRWNGRVPRPVLLAVGMALVAVGTAIAAGVFIAGAGIAPAIVGWAFAGLGMGLSYSAVTLAVIEGSPEAEQGRASAALSLLDTLGIAVGAGLAGAGVALADGAGWSPAAGLRPAFLLGGLGAVAAVLVARRMVRAGVAPRPGAAAGPARTAAPPPVAAGTPIA